MITCNNCQTKHKAIFEETGQGHGCSASVFVKNGATMILGHYGSAYCDGDLYTVTPGTVVELGTICDDCVRSLVNSGRATLSSEGNYFGLKHP